MLLAGDIGGTKTILAVFSLETGPRVPLAQETFPSAAYPHFETLVREFLSHISFPIDLACFGVAGPIVLGRATITNLPWVIEEQELQTTLHLSAVRLLNDLQSIAYGVDFLEPAEIHTLNEGEPVLNGNIAVIAPGTGLGESFLTWNGLDYLPHVSEGGHASFAPLNELQIGLLRYLFARFGHVSYERVCSGMGIPNIYAYLKESGLASEPPLLSERIAAAPDPTRLILQSALDGSSELCIATLKTFVSILGSEASNLALKVMATGGVYIGGGIPPRILSFLEDEQFLEAFHHKGRFVKLLQDIPVRVILNPMVALLGAAAYGLGLERG
jgi:glucokinase